MAGEEQGVYWRAAVSLYDGIESYPLTFSHIGPAETATEARAMLTLLMDEYARRYEVLGLITYRFKHLEREPMVERSGDDGQQR